MVLCMLRRSFLFPWEVWDCDLSSAKCALVVVLVALAGALQPAAVSAVVLLIAVVVHMAVPQGVASVPPVRTMTMSNSALTSAQPTTLHALFQLFLVHGRLHFRQAFHASQTLIFNLDTFVCAIATQAAVCIFRGVRKGFVNVIKFPCFLLPLSFEKPQED